MADDISQNFRADVEAVSPEVLTDLDERVRVMSLVSHLFLRLWTRLALETGQKLRMTPSQFELGTYKGKMNWIINEGALSSIEKVKLSSVVGKGYSLAAELYELNDALRLRVYFSLEEDEVKGEPVFVSYLVYDESASNLDLGGLTEALAPSLPSWSETILTKKEEHLWEYARANFECVGV